MGAVVKTNIRSSLECDVVGAESVVLRKVKPFTIVMGVPDF